MLFPFCVTDEKNEGLRDNKRLLHRTRWIFFFGDGKGEFRICATEQYVHICICVCTSSSSATDQVTECYFVYCMENSGHMSITIDHKYMYTCTHTVKMDRTAIDRSYTIPSLQPAKRLSQEPPCFTQHSPQMGGTRQCVTTISPSLHPSTYPLGRS